jgi:outer membrane biosynthesis protein TonB
MYILLEILLGKMTFLYSSYIYSPMKLSLKSIFPSTLFNKITLKTAILVALVLFYLVIMFSSSREGLETTAPQPQSMADVQNMIDQVTKTPTEPSMVESDSATSSETPAPTEATPTKAAPTKTTPTPTPTESETPAVETPVSPSKTPYAIY